MEGMRVAYTLEQCWHRVPGGTAVAALEVARALPEVRPDVTLLGVSGTHHEDPSVNFDVSMDVAGLSLRAPWLYEASLRFNRPRVESVWPDADLVHCTTLIPLATKRPMVATVHDVLVTFALLAFFRYDLTLNVIAAILTVTGYSTNDTIVIFDRVRENMRKMRRDSLAEVINASINQTLGRTVITAGTALLSAVALLLFGGEVLHGFAFTMVVGIITGTYSSVFVAAAIVTVWHRKAPSKLAGGPVASSASPAPAPPARRSKAQRKVKAS